MKALSIKQPWLWAITDLDKQVENRTWKPFSSNIGQRICLHASKADDRSGVPAIRQISGVDVPDGLPRGAIVAIATLAGWISETGISPAYDHLKSDKWFFGPIGWVLEDIQKLDNPIPCRGALGLWDIPQGIMAQLSPRPANNNFVADPDSPRF